ncbi:reverse transcriptase domain-containing protein [Tanacetum coccineum]|uniref:Reverse transcriptase domain-containing protein n=1 Tax=Tanacetum coccineum TaxID=301880 RepID=A0ABQ5AAA3_9ASTR
MGRSRFQKRLRAEAFDVHLAKRKGGRTLLTQNLVEILLLSRIILMKAPRYKLRKLCFKRRLQQAAKGSFPARLKCLEHGLDPYVVSSGFKMQSWRKNLKKEKSVNEIEVLTVVEEEGDSWMTPIHEYLTDETLPSERKKTRTIKQKDWYYWPTMHKDARALIKACQECQVHKPVQRNPQEKLNPITPSWPFYKWGIDITGPFPERPGKVKFLIVVMDYFTKWIEAKPVATITGNQVKKFVWENIVCRFGLPGEIISDNGKQFRDNPFKDWCEKLCIQQHFSSVKHPQTNGLVERANQSLGEGIKARMGKENKNWMEEISHVLWAHRTMVKSSNGDTPFSLTYETEAVIPAEIEMPTFRTGEVDVTKNDEALKINLELLEEKREQAAIREAKSKR